MSESSESVYSSSTSSSSSSSSGMDCPAILSIIACRGVMAFFFFTILFFLLFSLGAEGGMSANRTLRPACLSPLSSSLPFSLSSSCRSTIILLSTSPPSSLSPSLSSSESLSSSSPSSPSLSLPLSLSPPISIVSMAFSMSEAWLDASASAANWALREAYSART